MTIMIIVNIFSLSVSGETLPKPTDVMQVIVKYKAEMYMVHFVGPPCNSRGKVIFGVMGMNGDCVFDVSSCSRRREGYS